MYVNPKIDAVINDIKINKKSVPSSLSYFFRGYLLQQREPELNPFNIPIIFECGWNLDETSKLLDFLYDMGIKSFIFADASTACLRTLSSMLSDSKYSVSITQSYTWNIVNFGYTDKRYGVVVELKKKRKQYKNPSLI